MDINDLRIFEFHWLNDCPSEFGLGHTVAQAFSNLGYSRGAVGALDWYEDVTDCNPFCELENIE